MTMAPPSIAPRMRQSPTLFSAFVMGVEPHTTQAQFLECRTQTKVAAWGRRWGKSTAAALDASHLAVVGEAEGQPTTQMLGAHTSDPPAMIAGAMDRLP